MAHSKYLESLTKEQYQGLSKKLWEIQNHKCFICEGDLDIDIQSTNIDHIKPLANGGKDAEDNFAIVHEHCNKSKQDADLKVAKSLAKLNGIIKEAEAKKEIPSLKHVLQHFNGSKFLFKYKIVGNEIVYSFDDIGDCNIYKSTIFIDQLSNEKTVFINIPIEYLFHDEIINPRGINSSISLLVKEFYKRNPQLHLSLARIDDNKIKIFDGQHKAVSQLILGVRSLVVRVFISPDVDRLIETNTTAGSKLKQIAFDKAIVRQLHDTLYAERIRQYQKDNLLDEECFTFSEQNLVDYFKGEKLNIRGYIINSQKNGITRNSGNKLQSYINFEGRGSELPLSYSTFEKTILSTFVNSKKILITPINYKMEEGLNPRVLEKEQIIQLCNIIAEELLIDKYNLEIGTHRVENNIALGKDTNISDMHLIACRLFKEEIIHNWIMYIELLINSYFAITGAMFDRENLFQQKFPEQLWENIRTFIINLRELPVWKDRGMSSTIFGGKNNYDFWKHVFETGSTPAGVRVLAKPLNVTEMIKK